jgi:hypothetical protein
LASFALHWLKTYLYLIKHSSDSGGCGGGGGGTYTPTFSGFVNHVSVILNIALFFQLFGASVGGRCPDLRSRLRVPEFVSLHFSGKIPVVGIER